MPTPDRIAVAHYRSRRRIIAVVARAARQAWRQVDRADLSGSWRAMLPRLLVTVAGAQLAAARQADEYLTAVLAAQGLDADPDGSVQAVALSGVASDGRSLDTLLTEPVITTKLAISRGATVPRAMAVGYTHLDMIARTQVADAGRVADQVALTARPAVTGYVRMVVGSTCSRCLILAGRRYEWNQGFQRHPNCDCIHIPAAEDTADDLRTNPRAAFDAMPPEEQDRVFGKAGAEAIRDGADMARVVNARRGMYTAGGRLFTHEAAGRRPRLMPEQILREADGDRAEAIRLLRLHRYIL